MGKNGRAMKGMPNRRKEFGLQSGIGAGARYFSHGEGSGVGSNSTLA